MVVLVERCRLEFRQIRTPLSRGKWVREILRNRSYILDTVEPRKVSKFSYSCPYRKPTQVGGMSILRRVEELSSRNSAK